MLDMDRLPFGVMLTLGSLLAAWRLRTTWSMRHVAVGRRDRVLTTAAPAAALCCALAALLGIAVILAALGMVGVGVIGVLIAILAVAVAAVVGVYLVVAVREWRRDRSSSA